MSDQITNFLTLIDEDFLTEIDNLNLPVIQKHHVRLLLHCLQVFKNIVERNEESALTDENLRLWCEVQSSTFGDQSFSDVLFDQMCAARKKLLNFSIEIKKDLLDLTVCDLVLLTNQNSTSQISDPKEKM